MTSRQASYQAIYQAALDTSETQLHAALQRGQHIDDITQRYQKFLLSPVGQLAIEGKVDAVNFLLDHGANKITAIICYAMGGHSEIVESTLNEVAEKEQKEPNAVCLGMEYYRNGAVQGYAIRGDTKRVTALLEAGASTSTALFGYAMGGYSQEVDKLLPVVKDPIIAIYGYATGGHSDLVDKQLALSDSEAKDEATAKTKLQKIDNAADGYLSSEHTGLMLALLEKQGQTLNQLVIRFTTNQCQPGKAHQLIALGADPALAVYGYTVGNNVAQKNTLQSKKAPADKNAVIPADYQKKIRAQYEKQKSERNWRSFWVVMAAIFLSPFSLFCTLPRWFKAKQNEPIQKLKTTRAEYAAVREKRINLRGSDPKISDAEKPKKILYSESVTKLVFLVDRAQLKRYRLFSQHNIETLQTKRREITDSKADSKEIIARLRP